MKRRDGIEGLVDRVDARGNKAAVFQTRQLRRGNEA